MRILITGATGLIGRAIVDKLAARGDSVHYLTTSHEKLSELPNATGFFWNPEKCEVDENALIGVEAIIHLAGAPIDRKWTRHYKQEIIQSRVFSANLLFKLLRDNPHQVSHFISASGISIYPDSLTEVYSEESPRVSDSFLGNVVIKWENAALQFKRLVKNVSIIRTGMVLSSAGGALPQLQKLTRTGLGAPVGTGKQMVSWIHIDDLADLYIHVLDTSLDGIYNAVAPNPVSNEMLMRTLATIMGKPFFMPAVPGFAIRFLLGERADVALESQNVSSQKIMKTGFVFNYAAVDQALLQQQKKAPRGRS